MKVKKDSEIKFFSAGLSLGGSVVRSSKQVIRTGLNSSADYEDEQNNEKDGYMRYLSRHEQNMLRKLSPRSRKRYEKMLEKQKEADCWSRTMRQKQSTFQDRLYRDSPAGKTAEETYREPIHTTAASKGAASGQTGMTGVSGGAAAGSTAGGIAAAGGTAAAGAATGGAAIAGAAAASASKKVAGKVKESLAVMAAERNSQLQEAGASGKKPVFGWAKKLPKRPEGEPESHAIMYIGVLLILAVLLLNKSASYIVDLSIDQMESREEDQNLISAAKAELPNAALNIGGYKYKSWYGLDGNWCAMFVSYCADQCGYIDAGVMPKTASVANMISWYKDRDGYREAGTYTPKGGDIIFFGNGMSHTGIVIEYDPDKKMVMVIEGNSGSSSTTPYHKGSRVRAYNYSIYYKYIVGYGIPDYPEE